MYLTVATLVIVPPHLFIQWQSEIHKHCEDSLRVYVTDSAKPMPDAEYLANEFDIVLFSSTREILDFASGFRYGSMFF
jgi:hypothetical protein